MASVAAVLAQDENRRCRSQPTSPVVAAGGGRSGWRPPTRSSLAAVIAPPVLFVGCTNS